MTISVQMRSIDSNPDEEFTNEQMLTAAGVSSDNAVDQRSDYGVGVALQMKYNTDRTDTYHVYSASNIVFSGIQSKVHAEQLALHQAILDMETQGLSVYAEPVKCMVVTSESDLALKCGHCLQVYAGACEYYSWDMAEFDYVAGRTTSDDDVSVEFKESTVLDLIGTTYVSR